MNIFTNKLRYIAALLLLLGLAIPRISLGQSTTTISGDVLACVGDIKVYTPGISNIAYTYEWSVSPVGMGTVLVDDYTGATIQWLMPGSATITLDIKDPLNGNQLLYTADLIVDVGAKPAPYITTNVELGCQQLNQDSSHIVGDFIAPPPPPKFDSTHCQLVCENSTVEYYANGDPGSTFTWVVTGAVSFTPSGSTCIVNWGATGFGQVRLTETTVYGCVVETYFCVEIIEAPVALFESVPSGMPNPITICLNSQVVLQDMSTGSASSPIVSYLWDWGDGNQTPMSPASAGNPVSHRYTNPGTYMVTLTVVNSCGCESTFTHPVEVLPTEAPEIACPRVVCEGETAVYSVDPMYACSPSSWSVTGGTIISATGTQVRVRWDNVDPNTGFGYVMFNSCPPCQMTVVEAVPVVLNSGIIQGPPVICEGRQYVYRMPKWPSTEFNWSISSGPGSLQPSDQRNEIVLNVPVGVPPGTAIVLDVAYKNTMLGCKGFAQIAIDVMPQESIVGDAAVCENGTGVYTLAGGNPGNWELYDATGGLITTGSGPAFSHNFTTPGNYRLAVSGAAFCPPEDMMISVVATPPPPAFITGQDRACPNIQIRYDAGTPMPGTTFHWSVSGGGSVNAAVGNHSYITFGTLPATITVTRVTTDGLGCTSDPLFYNVDVAVPPLSIAGADTVCHSSITGYSLNYTDGDSYSWELSNPALGSVASGGTTPNVNIQWNIPPGAGASVWLIAKVTKCGTERRDSTEVYIKGFPVITGVNASPNPVCSGEPVTITVSTVVPLTSGTVTVNWGDGNTIPYVLPAPITHTYYTTGATANMAFTPTLTLSDANGCMGSATATAPTITVKPAPIAVLSPTGPIVHCDTPFVDTLLATITTGLSGTNDIVWTVPAGAPNPGNTAINNNANKAGHYYVTVTNSISGCSSISNVVNIIEFCDTSGGNNCLGAPSVTLAGDTAHCGSINVSATVGSGATGYSWSVPPGITITSSSATGLQATANAAGIYTISYTVMYAPSCMRTYNIQVLVPYVAGMRHSITCDQPNNGYEITLYDRSTHFPLTPITNRAYYRVPAMPLFGNVPSTPPIPQAANSTEMYYIVVGDGVNPPCTYYETVSTPAFPAVNVFIDPTNEYMPGCEKNVTFKLGYNILAGNIQSYLWNFGDIPNSYNASDINPISKVYNAAGPKTPTLTVTDEYGCQASDNVAVSVVGNPYSAGLQVFNSPACQNNPVTLMYDNQSTPFPGSYTWYHENSPLFTGPGISHNVFTPGGYWVLGTDPNGCLAKSDMQNVEVIQVPPVSIVGNTGACDNQPFTLTTQDYGPNYTYVWSGAATGTGTSITVTLPAGGPYTFYVTVTENQSGMNCTQTSPPFDVMVHPPPPPPNLSFNILSCDPYRLELSATGAPGTYNWSNGMSGTPVYTPFGGNYQVTLTDLNGCVVKNSMVVPKSLHEYIWVFPTGCFCVPPSADGGSPYLIGPIIPLENWAWLKDGGWDASGFGYMANYTPVPGHSYNMYLNNGWCQLTSGDMHYMNDTCANLPLPRPAGPGNEDKGDEGYGKTELSKAGNKNLLELSPNPASEYAVAHFSIAPGSTGRSMALVDVTGRVLERHTLDTDKGSLRLSLQGYASGVYQVVLYRNGTAVQMRKLAVAK